MRKWDATMPRQAPEEGQAHVVLALMGAKRTRMEFSGKLTREDADKLMQIAIGMMIIKKDAP